MPDIRAATSGFDTTGSSAAITPNLTSTGFIAGDLAICVCGCRNTTAPGTWTETQGFFERFTQQNTGDSSGMAVAVFDKVLVGGEANPVFTHSATGKLAWAMIVIRPSEGGALSINGTPANTIDVVTGTTSTPPAATLTAAPVGSAVSCLLASMMATTSAATAITYTPPTNWTEPANNEASTNAGTTAALRQISAWCSYRLAQSGTVTPGTFTNNVTCVGNMFHYLVTEVPPVATVPRWQSPDYYERLGV